MGLGTDLSDSITNFLQQQPNEPSSSQPAPRPAGSATQLFNSINNFNAGIPTIPTHEDLAGIQPSVKQSGPLAGTWIGNWAAQHDDVLQNAATGLAGPFRNHLAVDPTVAPYLSAQGIDSTQLKPLDYKAKTFWGNVGQRSLETAPLALFTGGAGIGPLLMRQFSNLTGNIGGEGLRELFPNHPIIADIIGTLAGGSLPEAVTGIAKSLTHGVGDLFHTQGAAQREAVSQLGGNPAFNMPVSQVDDVLSKQGGSYWTPGRINAASELNKRQAINNISPPSTPTAAPSGGKSLSDYMRDLVTYGVGEGFGGGIGHAISHYTGIDPTLTDIVGSQLGGIAAALTKYKLPRLFSSGDFDQRVSKLVSDPATWQALQQQQQAPGIVSRLFGGIAAPAVNVPGMGY